MGRGETRFPMKDRGAPERAWALRHVDSRKSGGSELDAVTTAAIIEEIARGDGSLALTVASTTPCAQPTSYTQGRTNKKALPTQPSQGNDAWSMGTYGAGW